MYRITKYGNKKNYDILESRRYLDINQNSKCYISNDCILDVFGMIDVIRCADTISKENTGCRILLCINLKADDNFLRSK